MSSNYEGIKLFIKYTKEEVMSSKETMIDVLLIDSCFDLFHLVWRVVMVMERRE